MLPRYLRCMSDVTQILSQIERGDAAAADELLPLVYDELRKRGSEFAEGLEGVGPEEALRAVEPVLERADRDQRDG